MADPFYYETILNVPFDGSAGATIYPDFSYKNAKMGSISTSGASLTTAFSKFAGKASVNMTGVSNTQIGLISSPGLGVSSGNIGSIEMHVRFADISGIRGVFNMVSAGTVNCQKNASNQIEVSVSGSAFVAGGSAVSVGPFFHIAVQLDDVGGTRECRVYLDGTKIISFVPASGAFQSLGQLNIGVVTTYLIGQVCNLRVIVGRALYNGATITPPTAPFDLAPLPITGVLQSTFKVAIAAGIMPPITGIYAQVGNKVRDFQYGGTGKITGTTKIKGTPNTPVSRRVRLYNDRDGNLVSEQWSDATTGAYSFLNVATSLTYTVIAYDQTHSFRAVVADNLTPDPMP